MKAILLTIALAVSIISVSANSTTNTRTVDYDRQEKLDVSLQQNVDLETSNNDNRQNTGSSRNFSNIENRESILSCENNTLGKVISNNNKALIDISGYGVNISNVLQQPRSVFYKSRNQPKNAPAIHIKIIAREDKVEEPIESLEEPDIKPEYELRNNYPNPFNPATTICFTLPQSGNVNLSIFNIKGQLVKTLVNEVLPAGEHSIVWDGSDNRGREAGSGVYFYKLDSSHGTTIKRMILLK